MQEKLQNLLDHNAITQEEFHALSNLKPKTLKKLQKRPTNWLKSKLFSIKNKESYKELTTDPLLDELLKLKIAFDQKAIMERRYRQQKIIIINELLGEEWE